MKSTPKPNSSSNLKSLNLIPKMRINSPIPRHNLPFQLNLHRPFFLDIHKIPSHSPGIRIPQNPIPFLLLPSHGQLLRNTHPQTTLRTIPHAKATKFFHLIDVDDFLFRRGDHVDDDTSVFGDGNLVHDSEFGEGTRF